jgi:hypothetical protein
MYGINIFEPQNVVYSLYLEIVTLLDESLSVSFIQLSYYILWDYSGYCCLIDNLGSSLHYDKVR